MQHEWLLENHRTSDLDLRLLENVDRVEISIAVEEYSLEASNPLFVYKIEDFEEFRQKMISYIFKPGSLIRICMHASSADVGGTPIGEGIYTVIWSGQWVRIREVGVCWRLMDVFFERSHGLQDEVSSGWRGR